MSQNDLGTASNVARRLFSSLKDGLWLDAASCIDPADLQAQYDAAVALKLRASPQPKFAVSQEPPRPSPISRSARQALLPKARLRFPWPVLGAMSLEELDGLSPLDLMARIMESREAEFLAEHQGLPKGFPCAESGREKQESELLRVVLGEIQESDDVTHVVFRRVMKEPNAAYLLEPIGCVTFRNLPVGWRVALSRLAGTKPALRAGPWKSLVDLREAWL